MEEISGELDNEENHAGTEENQEAVKNLLEESSMTNKDSAASSSFNETVESSMLQPLIDSAFMVDELFKNSLEESNNQISESNEEYESSEAIKKYEEALNGLPYGKEKLFKKYFFKFYVYLEIMPSTTTGNEIIDSLEMNEKNISDQNLSDDHLEKSHDNPVDLDNNREESNAPSANEGDKKGKENKKRRIGIY